MNPLRCIVALQFATTLALGQTTHQSTPASQPDAVVRGLYTQVVVRHPIGIPKGADMTIIAPHLSTALLHRINLAYACEGDFFRKKPDPNLKPEFEWLELGLFSGEQEEALPSAFQVGKAQAHPDGTLEVAVKLTYEEPPPYRAWSWHIAAVVIQESGQYVVDDVIYLKHNPQEADYRLSQALSWGCDGPRWIGYPKRLTNSTAQR